MFDFRFDIAALVISLISYAIITMKRNYLTRESRVFVACIVLNMISAVCNIISTIAVAYNSAALVSFAFLAKFIHFILIFLMTAGFYTASLIRVKEKGLGKIDQIILIAYLGINVVLLCTSFFTKFYFYFDGEYRLRTSFLYYLAVLLHIVMMAYTGILIAKKEKEEDSATAVYVVVAMAIYVTLTLVNAFVKGSNVYHFAVAVLFLCVHVILNNPEDYVAAYYSCFNDVAYKDSLIYHQNRNKQLHSIGISCGEMDFLKSTYSDLEIMAALKPFTEFARARFGAYNFYVIGTSQFVVQVKGNNSLIESTMSEIRNYFMEPISIGGVKFVISPLFAVVEDREKFESVDSYFEVLSYCMNHTELFAAKQVLRVTSQHITFVNQEQEMVLAVTRAIKNDGVLIYYQPIYSAETGGYPTSEALVRIKDEKLGFISPADFIPILERNGMIVELGELILRRVCEDYQKYEFPKLGIERVEVNLSGRQLVVPGIYKKLLGIIKENQVPKDAILFEITESYTKESAQAYILENIKGITDNGIKLALDDFGTGYSTMINLIRLPFEIIKIDKSLLDNAMADLKSMVLLKNNVNMLKELKKKIVVEGVETSEEAKMLKNLGVHYFQGYLYSKPVSVEEYVSFLKPKERSAK